MNNLRSVVLRMSGSPRVKGSGDGEEGDGHLGGLGLLAEGEGHGDERIQRNGWPAHHVAGAANGLHVERAAVVPVVVAFSAALAVGALEAPRIGQKPRLACLGYGLCRNHATGQVIDVQPMQPATSIAAQWRPTALPLVDGLLYGLATGQTDPYAFQGKGREVASALTVCRCDAYSQPFARAREAVGGTATALNRRPALVACAGHSSPRLVAGALAGMLVWRARSDGQLWPNRPPVIRAQFLSSYRALGVVFDEHGERRSALANAVHHVLQMPSSGAAL